ncbi:MAG: polysaccharide biosynthesis protein [Chloroflexi bacterium]|nr:polysaccharide biosynthesis protein [Chloroflexota bacterium]
MKGLSSAPLRFSPTLPQLMALDALVGAAAYALAMVLRFVDEGSVPTTYAQRLVPWIVIAAVVQIGTGELMSRLRRPTSRLARRPIAPFLLATGTSLVVVLVINDVLLREALAWRLPHFVAIVAPLLAGAASAALRLAAARSIDLEELLPRRSVPLDASACRAVLANKRILITGGAGSIGAELARQALGFGAESVLAVDMNETGLYELEGELASSRVGTCIADVVDGRRMQELFIQVRPHIVFHAAAYKHVPLVEANPDQGFLTNVLGTLSVCEAAMASGAERVVVISTDKAVNPSSFMGLTKRVAELIVAAMTPAQTRTVFSTVRFGNVLGSRGSVVPTLIRQIESGGPLTITDPDAQRFFMTLAEAAQLVLVACAFDGPGGVYVLDMGEEVRIEQLAERLMRLKGVRPGRDLSIQYVGLRPGEKLREELHAADERLAPTEHAMVWRVVAAYDVDGVAVLDGVRELDRQRRAGELRPSDYASRLRALVETAVQPTQAVASR